MKPVRGEASGVRGNPFTLYALTPDDCSCSFEEQRAALGNGQEVQGPEGIQAPELPADQSGGLQPRLFPQAASHDGVGIRAVELLPSSEESAAGRIHTLSFRVPIPLRLHNG